MTKEKRLHVTIDNRAVEVRPNATILQAARENNIYIPSLCTLEHLPSYGACRLCIVEVDGLRGFPTSCTTPVEDGMVIRTDTAEIRSLRQEILKLLLSEHPASCLFCTEQDECKGYQGTIRKVGSITGCRYCPNDARCELQEIVDRVGLTDTSYPVYYRNVPVEKYDPFYDRDYNLCILCGRCVRVCSEVRLNGTLSFKQRGKLTTIGPAFDRTHLDAGCEFCGACVTVCPTGALATKVSKWYGRPEGQTATTCGYCSVGCQVVLQTRKGEVIDALPDYESPVDNGIICVKGRFAIPEYVQSPERITSPWYRAETGYEEIPWERAIEMAAARLKGLKGDDCLMFLSPSLTNEDLFTAQEFMREVMGSDNIGSSVMTDLGEDLGSFLNLVVTSPPFEILDKAEGILALGFDSSYGYSPLGIRVKRAARRGVPVLAVDDGQSNLDLYAEMALTIEPEKWADFLALLAGIVEPGAPRGKGPKWLADLLVSAGRDMDELNRLLARSGTNVVVLGPDVLSSPARGRVLRAVASLRDRLGWRVVVAHPYTNLGGMLAMGAFPGVEPGRLVLNGAGPTRTTVKGLDFSRRRKVMYLIGEVPSSGLPECDYLIYQNVLAVHGGRGPDLILPALPFTESAGTMISGEGRLLQVQKAVEPQGKGRPDWWILGQIAEAVRKGKVRAQSLASVQQTIKKRIPPWGGRKKLLQFGPVDVKGAGKGGTPKGLPADPARARHRGFWLSDVVPGMKVIEGRNNE